MGDIAGGGAQPSSTDPPEPAAQTLGAVSADEAARSAAIASLASLTAECRAALRREQQSDVVIGALHSQLSQSNVSEPALTAVPEAEAVGTDNSTLEPSVASAVGAQCRAAVRKQQQSDRFVEAFHAKLVQRDLDLDGAEREILSPRSAQTPRKEDKGAQTSLLQTPPVADFRECAMSNEHWQPLEPEETGAVKRVAALEGECATLRRELHRSRLE